MISVRDLINEGQKYKTKIKKLIKKRWLNNIIWLWREECKIETSDVEEFEYKQGKYCNINKLTTRIIRKSLFESKLVKPHYILGEVEDYVANDYLLRIKKLNSIRHKNLAIRCWNGDVFGNHRLYQMGLHQDGKCHFCGLDDTREHLLKQCCRALDLQKFFVKEYGKDKEGDSGQQWIGLNDKADKLELRLECLYHLIHFRTETAKEIWSKSKAFIESVKRLNKEGFGDINIDRIL